MAPQCLGRAVRLPAATCPQSDLAVATLLLGWSSEKWDIPGYRTVSSSHTALGDCTCVLWPSGKCSVSSPAHPSHLMGLSQVRTSSQPCSHMVDRRSCSDWRLLLALYTLLPKHNLSTADHMAEICPNVTGNATKPPGTRIANLPTRLYPPSAVSLLALQHTI